MSGILKNDTFAAEINADVAELVDAQDLGSCALWRGGSSPFIRTRDVGAVSKVYFNAKH